jgi:hypothetical protein
LIAFEGIQQRFGATAFALLAHHDFGILKFYNARKEQRNYDSLSSVSDKVYISVDRHGAQPNAGATRALGTQSGGRNRFG